MAGWARPDPLAATCQLCGKSAAGSVGGQPAVAGGLPKGMILLQISQRTRGPKSRPPACFAGCLQAWVEGGVQSGAPVFADVRDVARAHVLAAETPSASGRYIVAGSHSTPASEISATLQVGGRWRRPHRAGVVSEEPGGVRGISVWRGD